MTNCCFLHPLHKVPLPIFRKMSGVEKKSKAKARRDRQRNVVKRMGENQQAEEGWVSNPRRIPRHERRELNRQAAAAGIALVPLPIGNQSSRSLFRGFGCVQPSVTIGEGMRCLRGAGAPIGPAP